MFRTEEFTSGFQPDILCDVELEHRQHCLASSNLEELPPLLFTPATPQADRARGLDVAISRGHTHPRAFTHSPQPSYSRGRARHRNSDSAIIGGTATFQDEYPYSYLLQPAHSEYVDASLQYMGSPMHQEPFAASYPATSADESAPEAASFGFSPSTRGGVFSTHSSPGYFRHDLPDVIPPRPHSDYGRLPSYPSPYHHLDNFYNDGALSPRSASFHESTMPQCASNTWNTLPGPAFPHIPPGHHAPAHTRPSTPSRLFNAFGRHPAPGELRRVPQMFKIHQARKKQPGKKQMMACLFCRERKIGCIRPAEGDPDQTCNQCARRGRTCEYPTESRRGQHNRGRFVSRKPPPVSEHAAAPPSPQTTASSSLADDT